MLALYRQVPRLRRERLMDMAEAAAVPTWVNEDRQKWWDRQVQAGAEATAASPAAPPAFTFNGVPMGTRALRQKLGQVLGSGLSA